MKSNAMTPETNDSSATLADLQSIADYFKLGRIKSFVKSSYGRANSTFFVSIDDGTKYAIRILKDTTDRMLENEHFVQNRLMADGVLTSSMLLTEKGDFLYPKGPRRATVSKKIKGRHPELPVSEKDCYLIGGLLSKFHSALDGLQLPHREENSFLEYKKIRKRINSLAPSEYTERITSLFVRSGFNKERHDLPVGIIHGDLHVNNLLINNSRMYVLDLQTVDEGPYILDVGRSIADVCSHKGKVSRKKVKSFLAGYEESRQLTPHELELLNSAIIYGAVAASVWFDEYGDDIFANHFLEIGVNLAATK